MVSMGVLGMIRVVLGFLGGTIRGKGEAVLDALEGEFEFGLAVCEKLDALDEGGMGLGLCV